MTENSLGRLMLDEFIAASRDQKATTDKAIVQVSDEKLRHSLDPETNSIAVTMKLMSRFLQEFAVLRCPTESDGYICTRCYGRNYSS